MNDKDSKGQSQEKLPLDMPMIGPLSLRFLASSGISLLGNSIAGVILPLVMLATTGDALAAGLLALICMVPQAIAGVLGGALLDRINRRDVSVLSDIISAISVAMLPIIDATVGLNFGWFVLFGLLGALGDVPGMTARDSLMPMVCERDSVSMQRFVGVWQSVESLMTIIGPAVAALCISFTGATNALVITAGTSALAAIVTCTIPRSTGRAPQQKMAASQNAARSQKTAASQKAASFQKTADFHPVRMALNATKDGLKTLFASDPILRTSMIFTLLILVAMGGYQGLLLPVHFTLIQRADLLGYVLSDMSVGILIGSLIYAHLAPRMSRRRWYCCSLVGMMVGMTVMSLLPPFPLLLAGAAILGFSSGPFSALLNFKVFDLIPDEVRGASLGTQNALMLVVAPLAVFGTSVLVTVFGVEHAAIILSGIWAVFTLYALFAKAMRNL
ncbi:MAG: MFS transporter [Eggerthellaceae bacterium]